MSRIIADFEIYHFTKIIIQLRENNHPKIMTLFQTMDFLMHIQWNDENLELQKKT